jgi:YebC/PmpR family DNA-binding regulatory protein
MSGHSKWSSIKHKKAAADAKRGKLFTKLIKEISVAARLGGGDLATNPRLRTAVQNAKGANMPQDNIQRAIQKGTGELPGVSYEEARFEGYGPGGVAILVDILTDNKNRSVADIRHIFSRNGGNLGEPGCVAWMFDKKGLIVIEGRGADEEAVMEAAIEAGADDMKKEDDTFEITSDPEDFETVKTALEQVGFPLSVAEVSMVPQSTVRLEGKAAQQVIRLMDALEDHEDVQNVYANFDIPDEILQEVEAQ